MDPAGVRGWVHRLHHGREVHASGEDLTVGPAAGGAADDAGTPGQDRLDRGTPVGPGTHDDPVTRAGQRERIPRALAEQRTAEAGPGGTVGAEQAADATIDPGHPGGSLVGP